MAQKSKTRTKTSNTVSKSENAMLPSQDEAIHTSGFVELPRQRSWLVLLMMLVVLALVVCDGVLRYRRLLVCVDATLEATLPERDPSTVSGYRDGMRIMVLPFHGLDGYQWIMHTQTMCARGDWRIRSTDRDNAPYGREIHWSHSLIWWLVALGSLYQQFTGEPLAIGIEMMAPISTALLLVAMLLILPWVIQRRFGSWSASIFTASFVGISGFHQFFLVGGPDHHGIVSGFLLLMTLCLCLAGGGWVTQGAAVPEHIAEVSLASKRRLAMVSLPIARRWFITSGLFAAASLWVSAATAVPAFAGIGLAALGSGWINRSRLSRSLVYCPSLWRWWGWSGALGSLFFYLLEYFPAHLGMRLEVNHPLYAFAFWGATEWIAQILEWRRNSPPFWKHNSSFVILLAASIAVLALPAMVIWRSQEFFVVADSFLWRLHADYIDEFKSTSELAEQPVTIYFFEFLVFPLLGGLVLVLLRSPRIAQEHKGLLLMSACPAFILILLGIGQVRWLGIANGFCLALIPVVVTLAYGYRKELAWPKPWWIGVGSLALMIYLVLPAYIVIAVSREVAHPIRLTAEDIRGIFARDVAYYLRRNNPDRKLVVLSSPTSSLMLMYPGNFQVLGTLYWENIAGLKAAAAIYAARTDQEALQLCRERGVTHIALFRDLDFVEQYIQLHRGDNATDLADAFAIRMLDPVTRPDWLKPIKINEMFEKQGGLTLFEIQDGGHGATQGVGNNAK